MENKNKPQNPWIYANILKILNEHMNEQTEPSAMMEHVHVLERWKKINQMSMNEWVQYIARPNENNNYVHLSGNWCSLCDNEKYSVV
jgi:hypothetical protein